MALPTLGDGDPIAFTLELEVSVRMRRTETDRFREPADELISMLGSLAELESECPSAC